MFVATTPPTQVLSCVFAPASTTKLPALFEPVMVAERFMSLFFVTSVRLLDAVP